MAGYFKLKQPLPVRTVDGTIVRVFGISYKGSSLGENGNGECFNTGIYCNNVEPPAPTNYETVCMEVGEDEFWHFCPEES